MTIAKIAVGCATYPIDRPYDYLVPAELEQPLRPGMRVLVPFGGGNRRTDGIVLAVQARESGEGPKLKSILALLDESPVLDGELLQLALWMRERCFCTVYDAARAILPAGLWFSIRDCWRLADGVDRESAYEAAGTSKNARRLIELLFANGRAMETQQIREVFGTGDPWPAIRLLEGKGTILQETSADRGIGDKVEQIATLTVPPEEAMAQLEPGRRRAPLQYSVMEQLCVFGTVSVKELCYFTGASSATLRSLEKKGLLKLEKRQVFRRPELPLVERGRRPELSQEQQAAYLGLKELLDRGSAAGALLYGVTGSGKTQVYLKLIWDALDAGKTALVLVPEIALTPQLMRIFTAQFGKRVAILHSSLSAGERYDEWKRARSGDARVVIGTRSAVFAPLPDLGLIIMDEEQEPSYKSEQAPRYHARDVARYRCAKQGILLVLGSATPSVESMYAARSGSGHLFTLRRRYNEHSLPHVSIVDMKVELREGNSSVISRPLEEALRGVIDRGEQAILFLNRRGARRMAVCEECGQVPDCPRCSVHLTYHSANHRLMCHYCGYSQPMPDRCPVCGGALSFVGFGTQQVESDLRERFPSVPILRMDADTVTATRTHEKILSEFRDHNIPILVGTQMVAKGLDFENVTLVGVMTADQALYTDDFRAGERTFSLLTQVVGRAGRGEKPGTAIVQTFTPRNEIIRRAARQDYDGFYESEIRLRSLRGFPPFADLFVLTASGLEETAVLRTCLRLRQVLTALLDAPDYRRIGYRFLGPAPAVIARVNDRYRYRLTMSIKNQKSVRELLSHVVRQAQRDKINRGVSIQVDVNPLD